MGLVDWLITGTTTIFCTRGLQRAVPPFKVESDSLKTSIPELGFELEIFRLVSSTLTITTRQAGGLEKGGICGA